MKLFARLILITFVIVLITSVASTIIYYSLSGRLLSKYQNQTTLNSANDFIFAFESEIQSANEDFNKLKAQLPNFQKVNLDSTGVDFIFTLVGDSLINSSEFKVGRNTILNIKSKSFKEFFEDNPNLILYYEKIENGTIIYYGKVINSNFLDRIAESIRAEVALVINDTPVEISNTDKNQKYLLSLINASHNLKFKNNFDLYSEQLDNADFNAAHYLPRQILTPGGRVSFLVFSLFPETVDFRNTLRNVMLLIVFAGSALTFVFVLLFTIKLRKQISLLSEAAEITTKGNLEHRVPIVANDELGKLGVVFNRMLAELKHKETVEKEYAEFITLINQNPTLKEVTDAALSKIIKSTGLTFGVFYVVDNKELRIVSSYGVSRNFMLPSQNEDSYSNAVEKSEIVEFQFNENYPEIKTGLASIKIKYLLIYPVIYNKETIGIIELASESLPAEDIKVYIENIKEQLAIGLINAKSLEQLENIVDQLSKLNNEYQKQNQQIIEQNAQLKELHKQLHEKAEELEKQRVKAVELTKAKSQFLASMSHELRTPLISILGLTELILTDKSLQIKLKERLNIVYRNGKKLLGLITNILEFSRLESDKIEIKKEIFLLSEFVDEVKSSVQFIAAEKKIQFLIETPKDKNFLLSTDKSKLEQVLTNLLVNAVKFTEAGSVKLVIRQKSLDAMVFEVIDTGIGIPEEHKEIVFSEFKQINGDAARKYGGAGLGLAICKRYVELLGGKLTLNSEIGQGSCFSFGLENIIVETIDNEYNSLSAVQEKGIVGNILKYKSALIISSNSNTSKFIKDYLSSYNFTIDITESVEGGLKSVIDAQYQSIIICPQDDDIDVWEIITRIKSNPATEETPVILATILENKKVGWIPNIFDFLIKPLSENKFEKIINRIENFSGATVEKFFLIGSQKSNDDYLIGSNIGNVHVKNYNSITKAFSELENEQPDFVVIDVDSFGAEALFFCTTLKQRRLTKNILIVFSITAEVNKDTSKELVNTINKLALREKNHPLDVLKDLKERLNIDDAEANKKLNLMEDIQVNETVIEKNETKSSLRPTIFIVDDDDDSLFTIGEFVKELNCETLFAHNGMECLLTLNHVEPDLILLDIMMPTMDGFETIKKIRMNEKYSHIPVIALTAYAMLDNKEVIEKNGFDDLITKPVDLKLLASKIQHYLKTKVEQQ